MHSTATLIYTLPLPISISHLRPTQTHQNNTHTAPKNATHTFHPTPVFCAMRNMRFMVPRSWLREFSNWSFIFSAKDVLSRISSPMRDVN
jgi:hypothetical protein